MEGVRVAEGQPGVRQDDRAALGPEVQVVARRLSHERGAPLPPLRRVEQPRGEGGPARDDRHVGPRGGGQVADPLHEPPSGGEVAAGVEPQVHHDRLQASAPGLRHHLVGEREEPPAARHVLRAVVLDVEGPAAAQALHPVVAARVAEVQGQPGLRTPERRHPRSARARVGRREVPPRLLGGLLPAHRERCQVGLHRTAVAAERPRDALQAAHHAQALEDLGAREGVDAHVAPPGRVPREERGDQRTHRVHGPLRDGLHPAPQEARVPRRGPDDVEAVCEPPEPDGEAPHVRPVAQEMEARVGVAREGDRLRQPDQDLGIGLAGESVPQGGQLAPEALGVVGPEAAVEAEQLALRHLEVLPPGLDAAGRGRQLRVRLHPEGVGALALGDRARDGLPLEAPVEDEDRVPGDAEGDAVAVHLEAADGDAGLAEDVHLGRPPATGGREADREAEGPLGDLERPLPAAAQVCGPGGRQGQGDAEGG